jgi:hypothetical protein
MGEAGIGGCREAFWAEVAGTLVIIVTDNFGHCPVLNVAADPDYRDIKIRSFT